MMSDGRVAVGMVGVCRVRWADVRGGAAWPWVGEGGNCVEEGGRMACEGGRVYGRMERSQLDTCSRASVAAGGTMRIQAMRQNAFGLCVRTPA